MAFVALIPSAHAAAPKGPMRAGGVRAAAPGRGDGSDRRVYLVHGFRRYGDANCVAAWADTRWSLWRDGWRGRLDTVALYGGDAGCTAALPGRAAYTADTSIGELGRAFAWLVYEQDTRYGRPVDVVAHSMGGLVVRAALAGVAAHRHGFPARLLVEDVVTLDTPHDGIGNGGCLRLECVQMRGQDGERLLAHLAQNPQSAQGTDWTLIGSDADPLVSADSATGMRAGHKVRYGVDMGLGHNAVVLRPDPVHPARSGYHLAYWNASRPGVHETANGWAPLHVTAKALYFWRRW
jgi:triacylglycerol esterase/lipase EstA (alpha/beta hydrolase family)